MPGTEAFRSSADLASPADGGSTSAAALACGSRRQDHRRGTITPAAEFLSAPSLVRGGGRNFRAELERNRGQRTREKSMLRTLARHKFFPQSSRIIFDQGTAMAAIIVAPRERG